jgi:hypothetical protein
MIAGPINCAPFVDGWTASAHRQEMHMVRIGSKRALKNIVVHTTDMSPGSFGALVKVWETTPGEGSRRGVGAHFLIGTTEAQGLVQFAPITHHTAHAGGPSSGRFVIPSAETGQPIEAHPNDTAVGIEVHNAGELILTKTGWRKLDYVEGKVKPGPHVYAVDDVIVDDKRPTRGWHKPTQYQLDTLAALIDRLDATLPALPVGASSRIKKGKLEPWQLPINARIVGHCSLDPSRKSDPHPPIMAWLRTRH